MANRLEVLKALGDNTRYAIYLELVRSPRPLSTSDIAETLGLHPNTVRPHLERMRELGLLDLKVESRGGVGRPQHRYLLAADAPSLGL
jgi:predicted ArsR family transcriptional regulator